MSMPLHPDLVGFGRRLEAAGIVAAVHSDHLCVRLPLLASVRVRYDGARLSFDPRFGAASRTVAVVSTFGSVSALVVGMTLAGIALPALVAAGSLGALASAYDVMRFIVTESAITRVTMLWSARVPPDTVRELDSGPARPMHAGASETVRAPLRAE